MISISFIVVLLATYSYSLPIKPEFNSTTPETQFTTDKTIVDNDIKTNTHLIPDSETSDVPNLHTQRSVMLNDKNETKTFIPHDDHQHESRAFDESTILTSTILTSEIPITPLTTVDSQTTKFSFTTMETKSNFEKKAIMPLHHDGDAEQESESKRDILPEPVDPVTTDENSVDITTITNKNVDVTESRVSTEQTTSGHLFSTITGQIKDKREEKLEKSETKPEEELEKSETKREESDKSETKPEEELEKSETKREESDKSETKPEEELEKSETKREESDKSETKPEEELEKSETKREESDKSETKPEEELEKSKTKREESDKSETKPEEELEKSETKREEESDKLKTKPEEELEKSETKRDETLDKFKDRLNEKRTVMEPSEKTPSTVETKVILPGEVTKTEVKFVEKQPMGDKKNTDN